MPCKGQRGCVRRGDSNKCDDTVAAKGDRCPRTPPLDYACTADHARALVCDEGAFALWRDCRGPEGCQVVDGRNVRCDTSLGQPGNPCAQNGAYACSVDGATMLVCDGKAPGPASSCRGPEGCRTERDTHKVDCDDSLAVKEDPCDQPKRIACAVDRKAELVCTAGKFAKKRVAGEAIVASRATSCSANETAPRTWGMRDARGEDAPAHARGAPGFRRLGENPRGTLDAPPARAPP